MACSSPSSIIIAAVNVITQDYPRQRVTWRYEISRAGLPHVALILIRNMQEIGLAKRMQLQGKLEGGSCRKVACMHTWPVSLPSHR